MASTSSDYRPLQDVIRLTGAGEMAHRLTEEAFASYALAQVEYGRMLLAEHTRDGAGCCRMCGRPSPCPVRRHGGELLIHFGQWRTDTQ